MDECALDREMEGIATRPKHQLLEQPCAFFGRGDGSVARHSSRPGVRKEADGVDCFQAARPGDKTKASRP